MEDVLIGGCFIGLVSVALNFYMICVAMPTRELELERKQRFIAHLEDQLTLYERELQHKISDGDPDLPVR